MIYLNPNVTLRAIAGSIALILAAPGQTWAWGNAGHEAVAYVAWQQLTPAAKQRVMQLLKMVPTLHNPSNSAQSIEGFTQWLAAVPAGLTADQQNQYVFMQAATWADSIKHQWLHDSDVPPAGSGPTDTIIGYTDTASHGYWHFVDTGFASDSSTVPATPQPNAATETGALRTGIASADPDLKKSYQMVWLLHLVGDLHQPLHGTVRFFKNAGDLGGNTVKISVPAAIKKKFGSTAPTELHAFWDDLPGEGTPAAALSVAVAFAKALPVAPATGISDTNPNDWTKESLNLAEKDAYTAPIGKSPTPTTGSSYTITQAYYNTALNDAQTRIALAGARLAKLLNDNLK